MKKQKIALVIGAGAFGTAIAQVLSHNFEKVILKVRSQDIYEEIKSFENKTYLSGLMLNTNLDAALTWEEVDQYPIRDIELIVSGLPTSGINEFIKDNYDRLLEYLTMQIPIVSLSKGIDPETLELSDDLFYDTFPLFRDYFCFLSGPSFAREIMQNQITLVTLAGKSKIVLENVIEMMNTDYFKVLASYDVKGVLLGGALKNILAIAGGIIEGLGHNQNTRAAMITRGIAEMLRFGKVYNARPETFYGLAGMGDLILTTTGELSRNKSFGVDIAKGMRPIDIIKSKRTVVEGYKTARAVHFISQKFDIRAQIFNGVYEVLYEEARPEEVILKIMRSPSKFEIESY